jgi:hypothetical protein
VRVFSFLFSAIMADESAQNLLLIAEHLLAEKEFQRAKVLLQSIIDVHPGTAAAQQAVELMGDLDAVEK